jgi:protoheme IX farnesyltransferase
LELIKFRLVLLVLVTATAGYVLAGGEIFSIHFLITLLGTATLGYCSSALNQLIEHKQDKKMKRTEDRPLAAGRFSKKWVLILSIVFSVISAWLLWEMVNPLTSILGVITLLSYTALYTPMKQKSSLNTLVGAIPGAIPPLMGWTAYKNNIEFLPMILFSILFLWQVPHFLAIAILYKKDFENGGFKMLPNLDESGKETVWQVFLYTLALVFVSVAPSLYGYSGMLYFVGALLLGFGFVYFALKTILVIRNSDQLPRKYATNLFLYSIFYLPVILILLFVDNSLVNTI